MPRLINRAYGKPDGLTSLGWVVWFAIIVAVIAFTAWIAE